MKKFIKLVAVIIIIIVLVLFVVNKDVFSERKLKNYASKSIYVYNLTEDKTEVNLNGRVRRDPASLVKIMTVYTALQHIDDLSAKAPVDVEGYQEMIAENGSVAGFYGNEPVTYRDLLYGAMLPSGGECAISLAVNICGNREHFIDLMNENAENMGLSNTEYRTAEGMDREGQYQSAEDVALLLKEALKDGNFRAIFTREEYISTPTIDHPNGVYMRSTAFYQFDGYEDSGFTLEGGKTGTTFGAGRCLAALVEKNGIEYIVVVMGAPYDPENLYYRGQVEDILKVMNEVNSSQGN